MLSKVRENRVDIRDRRLLQDQTNVNPVFQYPRALPNTSIAAPGPDFIMNVSSQPLGQVLVWGLVLVRVPKMTKQEFLSTDE